MKNLTQDDLGLHIISMVVPSVNENRSNLIILSKEKYAKLREIADRKTECKPPFFALFCDASLYHDIQETGFGCISKEQFDIVIKDEYNLTYISGAGYKPL